MTGRRASPASVRDTGAAPTVLSVRALNRATLARQLLLERANLSTAEAISHLVGMQAQAPNAPYVGLWTRLSGFRHGDLSGLIADRRAVRTHAMRGTIHLVTASDCRALKPLFDPVLVRGFANTGFSRNLAGIDFDELLAVATPLLETRPRTRAELARLLAERWPERDPISLAYGATYLIPTIQVPPRGIWGRRGAAAWTTVEAWLGGREEPAVSLDEVVLRYLGAFGPAAVADIRTWSGLTALGDVTERLRPRLRSFRDESGRELFDLPDAPRPDPDEPAPPRFLPEYDNVLFSHADRSRVIRDGRQMPMFAGNGGALGALLVDGFFRGTWKISRDPGHASLLIQPFTRLTKRDRAAVAAEGDRLLAFAAEAVETRDVRFSDSES